MLKSDIEKAEKTPVVTHEVVDTVTGRSYRIYFGDIPKSRQAEILIQIVKRGVDKASIVDASYVPKFLEGENLKLE